MKVISTYDFDLVCTDRLSTDRCHINFKLVNEEENILVFKMTYENATNLAKRLDKLIEEHNRNPMKHFSN